ncbi:hypothetical protein EPI10_002944 [Gossypium australe]|uniref:Uncharacterized protein n=1 Tax=Gossypium australe TaxID=47621 RepID=A0A5B6VG67_9ROSI|nr:hypothetical protein EPI10_002944 [Gossypium australe]
MAIRPFNENERIFPGSGQLADPSLLNGIVLMLICLNENGIVFYLLHKSNFRPKIHFLYPVKKKTSQYSRLGPIVGPMDHHPTRLTRRRSRRFFGEKCPPSKENLATMVGFRREAEAKLAAWQLGSCWDACGA